MELGKLIDAACAMERRAATLYRGFGERTADADWRRFWSGLANEETEHADGLDAARQSLPAVETWRTHVEGWTECIDEIDARLSTAEHLPEDASPDRQLSAALEIELSEIDALRRGLLEAAHAPSHEATSQHAVHMANEAARLSRDPQVQLQATLLKTKATLSVGK